MARAVRNPKINTRSARAKLPARREPYWTVLSGGCALGYHKGAKGGTLMAGFATKPENSITKRSARRTMPAIPTGSASRRPFCNWLSCHDLLDAFAPAL